MASLIRPNVLQMIPYSPGKPVDEVKRELGLDSIVKLASNENPLGPSPLAVEAIARAASSLHVYPDGANYALKQAIQAKFGVPSGRIVLGNGSDELIHLLGLIFLGGAEDEVVTAVPSFVRYDSAAELAPCKLTKVPLLGDMRYDVPGLVAALSPRTKLVFLASPNNPTGTLFTRSELHQILDALPTHAALILDEAYYEFAADHPEYPSSLEVQDRNVIGLRTFSKAYGLAGIRLGYGFAPEWVVDAIDRAREPFNVNSLAQVAGIAALQDDAHVHRTVENNRHGLKVIGDALEAAGGHLFPSYANFLLADLKRPTRPIFEALMRQGVIVRPGDIFGLPTCLRVSIGTSEENERFVHALQMSL